MTHPANALQAAIVTALKAYSALTTELDGQKVYDYLPQNTEAPYVLVGDDTNLEDDTKTANGWDSTVTLHVWDFETKGRKKVKTLMGHIYDALHRQTLTITGFSLVEGHCEFTQSFQDSEAQGAKDRFWHGVMRFRFIVKT